MRKIATSLLALALCAAFAGAASATVLMSEGFTYPDGNLVPNGGWATHSGTGTDIQVLAGRAIGNMANAPDDNRAFPAQPTTSSTYACFEVTIPDPGGSPKAVYFAHLKDTGTTNFFSRVYVLPVAGSNGFTFGLSFASTSTTTVGAVPWSTSSLSYNTPYVIVIKYDPVSLTSTMWVNPAGEGSPSISQTGTGTGIAISSFALRQSSTAAAQPPTSVPSGTANFTFSLDNLGVGTTFSDACYQYTPTKSSSWGQVKVLYR